MSKEISSFLSEFGKLAGTGCFATSATHEFFLPELVIEGVGEIAFPLVPAQVREMIARAEEAPFGKGESTALDPAVRKCHQIDASRFAFRSPAWQKFVEALLCSVREALGIGGRISAHPYKLLIYGPGGHFKPHRDTEKLDAMFGSLLIALPSKHEGGLLRIRHGSDEEVVDFSNSLHAREFQHVAFFADCEHAVEPVISGYRCCVAYNLCLEDGSPATLNLSALQQAPSLVKPLRKLADFFDGDAAAILLEHGYTQANCSVANLKGGDRLRAHALFQAAKEAGLDAHLALVELHQSGELQVDYSDWRGRHYDDDIDSEDGEIGEIYEESVTLSNWRDIQDRDPGFGEFRVGKDNLISSEPFGEGEPDEKESEGFTGNAGCTMDYWYRSAAVVVWSADKRESVLAGKNLPAAAAALSRLESQGAGGEGFRRLANAVVERLISSPPEVCRFSMACARSEAFTTTLRALARAGAEDVIQRLVDDLPPATFALCDDALWRLFFSRVGTKAAEEIVAKLGDVAPEAQRLALFRILAAAAEICPQTSLASSVASRVAHYQPLPQSGGGQGRSQPPSSGPRFEVRALLLASHLISNDEDRKAAREFLRGDGSVDYVRETLAPTTLDLPPREWPRGSLIPEITGEAIGILQREIARPLPPYPDWKRPFPDTTEQSNPASSLHRGYSGTSKTGNPIAELRKFMADPDAGEHAFVRSQGERSVIEEFIRHHQLDLDCKTIRKGRPYTLHCAKNSDSHKRALATRSREEALLENLQRQRCRA